MNTMPGMIVGNLSNGLRLLLSYRLVQLDGRPSLISAFVGLGLSLTVLGVFDYLRQEGAIVFSEFGAATVGSILFAVLCIAIIVARMHSAIDRLPFLLATFFSASPWFVLLVCLYRNIDSASPLFEAGWIVILAWGMVALARIVLTTFGADAKGGAAIAILSALVIIFIVRDRYLEVGFFYSYDPGVYESLSSLDVEDLYYRQPLLVGDKVRHLERGRPDFVDMYFIGFAGNGDQSIFVSEVTFAQRVVEQQFDAGGRSISLASQFEKLTDEPLANRHNLRAVLKHVAQIMDTDEDIAFIYLTSHGSADASLDTSLYPLELRDLSARDLREYLDEAGILWRIIVVSACYSGSFIEPLRDARSLVITASASDRSSFGCSDERDLTYFGEEFLKNQLTRNTDLIDVFNVTALNIDAKEVSEGLTPSKPQIFVGSLIRDRLDSLIRRDSAAGGDDKSSPL